jgi:hypothetical protein
MTPDPRIVEDLVVAGELRLKRARPEDHATIEAAVVWLLELTRRELRPIEVRR